MYVRPCSFGGAYGAAVHVLSTLFTPLPLPPPRDSRAPVPVDGDGGVVDCSCFGVVSGLEIASTVTSMFLALWWLAVRNTAGYAWVLQVQPVSQ